MVRIDPVAVYNCGVAVIKDKLLPKKPNGEDWLAFVCGVMLVRDNTCRIQKTVIPEMQIGVVVRFRDKPPAEAAKKKYGPPVGLASNEVQ